MENSLPSFLNSTVDPAPVKWKRGNLSFLDKTVFSIAGSVAAIYLQAESTNQDNFIRKVNPDVKLASLIYVAVLISLVSSLSSQVFFSAFIFILYIIVARLKILQVYRKIFFVAFIFGFLVIFPASLNIITPGEIIFRIARLGRPYHFFIYTIPENIGFTLNGLKVVSLIFLRVLNSVSFALLVVFTTPFPSIIKSFKIIRVPDTFLMIISLAYKYIFILSRTIEEMYFALKSRLLGNIKNSSIRNLVSGRIFFIFKKSVLIYENTYNAMVSRGYNGKVKLYSQNQYSYRDIISLVVIVLLTIIVFSI